MTGGYSVKFKVLPFNNFSAFVAHLVKNPPAMQKTWVQSLGREEPLEKGKTTHSSILAMG